MLEHKPVIFIACVWMLDCSYLV